MKRPDTPRCAVFGCGYWGQNLLRNFCDLGALAAVCDVDSERAGEAAARHGAVALPIDRILADPAIDAVAIAAPASEHARLVRAALEAGKHVFVEKPLALDLAEAEALVHLAARVDQRLMVGHLLQYHPAFLRLKVLVKDGVLGRLQYIYSNRLNLGRIRRVEDILWSFAPHDVSMILSLAGDEPERVHSEGGYYLHNSIADVTTTHLSFASGLRAHIFVSWLHPFKEQKLIVVGDRAMAVFDDGQPWDSKLVTYSHRIEWRESLPVPEKAKAEAVAVEPGEPLRLECQHFLDCVRTGQQPRTDAAEGLRVLRVLTAASASLKHRNGKAPTPSEAQPAAASSCEVPAVARRNADHGYAGVIIHESAYVDDKVEIGPGTKIWHFSHILPRTRIGRDVIIGQNVVAGPDVTIGPRCKLQNNVSVYKGVTLEEGVFCGPSCVFTNVMNPRAEIERKTEFRPTLVKRGVTIGANATIVCGTTLGEFSFIGAGAVVTRDVPAFALMVGAPARRIGWVSHDGERLGADLVCPRSKRRYRVVGTDRLEEIA